MKCVVCGLGCSFDQSELCLHCWCNSRNLECQCGCIAAQDEYFLEKMYFEVSEKI